MHLLGASAQSKHREAPIAVHGQRPPDLVAEAKARIEAGKIGERGHVRGVEGADLDHRQRPLAQFVDSIASIRAQVPSSHQRLYQRQQVVEAA